MVPGWTLLNMVLTRVVMTLGETPRMVAILSAPRVATVATVALVHRWRVATAPTLVRTLVLLSELDFVTDRMVGIPS